MFTDRPEAHVGWAGAIATPLSAVGQNAGANVAVEFQQVVDYLRVKWGRGKALLATGRYLLNGQVTLSNYTGLGGTLDPTPSARLSADTPHDSWTLGPLIVVGPNATPQAIRLPAVGGFLENVWAVPSVYPRPAAATDYALFTRYILDVQKLGRDQGKNGIGVLLGLTAGVARRHEHRDSGDVHDREQSESCGRRRGHHPRHIHRLGIDPRTPHGVGGKRNRIQHPVHGDDDRRSAGREHRHRPWKRLRSLDVSRSPGAGGGCRFDNARRLLAGSA